MEKSHVYHYNYEPKGNRLPALEKNILKYRALEMTIILFRAEELKRFVLCSIEATARFRPELQIPAEARGKYKKVWARLVTDGVISPADSKEVQSIIDYRNNIAHDLYKLTYDLGRDPISRDYSGLTNVRYDYLALEKLSALRTKIISGLKSRSYVLPLTLDGLLFESAEKAYREELLRLRRKIDRQIIIRKEELRRLDEELETCRDISVELEPFHPENVATNGTLTERGAECCYRLFDKNVSTLAVAYLMHISYRAALKRRRAWDKLGGMARER